MVREFGVETNEAAPAPKNALYTAIMAMSSVRVSTPRMILPIMAQGFTEQ